MKKIPSNLFFKYTHFKNCFHCNKGITFYRITTAGGKECKGQKKDQQDWPFAYGKGTIVELKKR